MDHWNGPKPGSLWREYRFGTSPITSPIRPIGIDGPCGAWSRVGPSFSNPSWVTYRLDLTDEEIESVKLYSESLAEVTTFLRA